MPIVTMQYIPMPMPIPLPGITIPGQTEPTPSPGPSGTSATPFPVDNGGSIGDAFAAPFAFPLNWKLIGAILLLILSVNAVETWYPEYVWWYVGILLLGTILASGRFANFGAALKRLVGG